MSNTKKRPSKKKKAVLRKLQESKELENAKTAVNVRANSAFTPPVNSARTTLAHKARPNKKRG